MNERWITIGAVASLLNISWPTAKKKLSSGEIPGLTTHLGYQRVELQVFKKWHDSRIVRKT